LIETRRETSVRSLCFGGWVLPRFSNKSSKTRISTQEFQVRIAVSALRSLVSSIDGLTKICECLVTVACQGRRTGEGISATGNGDVAAASLFGRLDRLMEELFCVSVPTHMANIASLDRI